MMFRVTIITGIVLSAATVFGQNVGINSNGANPAASAMLDVVSTNKGLLVPRVSLTATNAAGPITAPATSLLVYNTATSGAGTTAVTPGYYYNAGTTVTPNWKKVSTDGDHWRTDGNAGTIANTNFLGTTDAQDLQFRTNNANVMRIKSSTYPTVGIGTAFPVSTLSGNSAVVHIHDGGAAVGSQLVLSTHSTGINDRVGLINFASTQSTTNRISAAIESHLTAASGPNSSGDLRFITSSVTPAERFRIPSADQVHAMANGSASRPFYSWGADTDIGLYRITTNTIGLSAGGTERMRLSTTEAVFNEGGSSYDFRIEGITDADLFFVDGSTNRIGIKTAAPVNVVDIIETNAIGGTDVMQSSISGATGGALDAVSTNAANGYNTFETIASGPGSSILALHTSATNNRIALQAQTGSGNDFYGLYTVDYVVALNFFTISDGDLKTNLKPILSPLEKIMQLKPVTYNFKENNDVHANSEKLHYGFTAQNVYSVFPDLVALNTVYSENPLESDLERKELTPKYSSVNYQGIIPILTEGIKELQLIIDKQNKKIAELENKIDTFILEQK